MDLTPILPRDSRRRYAPQRAGRLALGATVGRATLAGRIEQLRALLPAIGRGDVILVEDGTLTGTDRVRLARECGDPEIVPADTLDRGGFPEGEDWALLLALLDRRQSAYAVAIGDAPPAIGVAPDLTRAIASNRSFAQVDDDRAAHAPAALEPHLPHLAREGWLWLPADPALRGLAAGGDGRPLAAAILARLEAVLGQDAAREPEMARAVINFILAREQAPLLLPAARRGPFGAD